MDNSSVFCKQPLSGTSIYCSVECHQRYLLKHNLASVLEPLRTKIMQQLEKRLEKVQPDFADLDRSLEYNEEKIGDMLLQDMQEMIEENTIYDRSEILDI